jgi:hypothetical protein
MQFKNVIRAVSISTSIALIILCIYPSRAQCNNQSASTASILDDLQRGFWLNKIYLNNLIDTKSPRKAGKRLIQDGFIINKQDNLYIALVSERFHEDYRDGFTILDLSKTNQANVYELKTAPPQASNTNIKEQHLLLRRKMRGDEITWIFTTQDNKKHNYQFQRVEPDLQQYINKIVLAGEYKDQSNRPFKFKESGLAEWPDKTFKYEIELDMVIVDAPDIEPTCDEFFYMDVVKGKLRSITTWGFTFQKGTLIIYEPEIDKSCGNKRILYKLKRVK